MSFWESIKFKSSEIYKDYIDSIHNIYQHWQRYDQNLEEYIHFDSLNFGNKNTTLCLVLPHQKQTISDKYVEVGQKEFKNSKSLHWASPSLLEPIIDQIDSVYN